MGTEIYFQRFINFIKRIIVTFNVSSIKKSALRTNREAEGDRERERDGEGDEVRR